MREEDLITIIALHDNQNITKAAESLYMSQPTLTKQLRRIENELGVQLVVRSNRGISFTPQGEYFAERARAIVGELADMRRELLALGGDNADQ